jgi:hypothetical protein
MKLRPTTGLLAASHWVTASTATADPRQDLL